MNPDVAIPSLDYNTHPQTPLLPTDGYGSSSIETELETNSKRQEINEDDGVVVKGSGGEEEKWTRTMGKPLKWYPKSEEDEKKMALYYEQVFASKGFDYVQRPLVDVIEYEVVRVNIKKALCRKLVRECVDHVVNEMNALSADGGWKLVGGDVVKANWRAVQGCIFFITFKATNRADPKDDAEKEYEAQVYRDFTSECQTELFCVKGHKKEILESSDRWRMILSK